jgi:hypothetical protein
MDDGELRSEVERLRAKNAALKSKSGKDIFFKVNEEGVSVYGPGRFPVTLYHEQWLKLLDLGDEIRAFISENAGALKVKAPAK